VVSVGAVGAVVALFVVAAIALLSFPFPLVLKLETRAGAGAGAGGWGWGGGLGWGPGEAHHAPRGVATGALSAYLELGAGGWGLIDYGHWLVTVLIFHPVPKEETDWEITSWRTGSQEGICGSC
jgi:hypothetical protein